jgi:starvation-inducible DNA-binding protein
MEELTAIMQQVLATAFSVYLSTHGAHWNVEGPNFYGLHSMFKDQYDDQWEALDRHAEQLRALDAKAPASLSAYSALSMVGEIDPQPFILQGVLLALMEAHETLIDLMTVALQMATDENQQGLANFLGERIETHQKHRWMLRSTARCV